MDEWSELQKNGINPALQKAGTEYRSAWRSVFGTSYEWTFVSPIPKFSQFDETGRVQVPAEVSEKLNECHAGRTVSAALLQADLSKIPAASYKLSTAIVTSFRIAPGKTAEYRELAKNYILPAMNKIGSPGYLVYRNVFGEGAGWITVRFADGVGEIDKGSSLRRGLDETTYNLVAQKLGALQVDVVRQIQTLDTELSFFSETTSNENE